MRILRKTHQAVVAIVFLASFVFTATVGVAKAGTMESTLFDMINQQREISLVLNPVLQSIAEQRSQMIFEKEFQEGVLTDNDSPVVLLELAGYPVEKNGEITAVVVFSNYLTPERASDLLYRSIKEQSEDGTFDLSVFNPEFVEVGIFVKESKLMYSNQKFNAYLCILEYAVPDKDAIPAMDVEKMEGQLLNLINQARKFPEKIFPGSDVNSTSMHPLYAGETSDLSVNKSAYLSVYEQEKADEAVLNIFQQMKDECRVSNGFEGSFMQSNGLNIAEIKISLLPAQDDDFGKFEMMVQVAFDNKELNKVCISGLAYSDLNNNGLYEPGEEQSGLPVLVSDIGIHSRTGRAGEIFEVVQKGTAYRVFVFDKEGYMYYQETDMLEDGYLVFNLNN